MASVDLSWNDNSDNEDGFRIYRGTSSGSLSQIATVGANTTSYTDTGLLDGERYYYQVEAYTEHTSSITSEQSIVTNLPAPSGVGATVQANDSIDVSWTDTINNGQYHIQISRDGAGYVDPSGGATTVGQNTTSANYGPNSDNSYDSQVGIDSSFQFRVRSETSHTSSAWVTSSTVYTDPIPPHKPSVSRPDGNTIQIKGTVKSDIGNYIRVEYREDTGSGYGTWTWFDSVEESESQLISGSVDTKGNTFTIEYNVGTSYQSVDSLSEDARYQFRIQQGDTKGGIYSRSVYADYGNSGNVYFEDDFESGDLSAWNSSNLSGDTGVQSGTGDADLTIGGADEGTYYFYGEGEGSGEGTWIQKNLGDLSNESDVIVKCAFATASLDDGAEDFGISWYDGSAWQPLQHFQWEYNQQGWYEVSVLVPSSYLSTDNRIRVGTTTSTGMYTLDHFAVDRVVVSDILHEYTTPAAPSNISVDSNVDRELTYSWTLNNSLTKPLDDVETYFGPTGGSLNGVNRDNTLTAYTFSSLLDGERYELKLSYAAHQPRHGSKNTEFDSTLIQGPEVTTNLPAPASYDISQTSDDITLSWSDVCNNEDSYDIYRGTTSGSLSYVTSTAANAQSYTETLPSSNDVYYYRVETVTEHSTSSTGEVGAASSSVGIASTGAATFGATSDASSVDASEMQDALASDVGGSIQSFVTPGSQVGSASYTTRQSGVASSSDAAVAIGAGTTSTTTGAGDTFVTMLGSITDVDAPDVIDPATTSQADSVGALQSSTTQTILTFSRSSVTDGSVTVQAVAGEPTLEFSEVITGQPPQPVTTQALEPTLSLDIVVKKTDTGLRSSFADSLSATLDGTSVSIKVAKTVAPMSGNIGVSNSDVLDTPARTALVFEDETAVQTAATSLASLVAAQAAFDDLVVDPAASSVSGGVTEGLSTTPLAQSSSETTPTVSLQQMALNAVLTESTSVSDADAVTEVAAALDRAGSLTTAADVAALATGVVLRGRRGRPDTSVAASAPVRQDWTVTTYTASDSIAAVFTGGTDAILGNAVIDGSSSSASTPTLNPTLVSLVYTKALGEAFWASFTGRSLVDVISDTRIDVEDTKRLIQVMSQ